MNAESTIASRKEETIPSVAAGATVRPARRTDLDAVLALLAKVKLPTDGVAEGFNEGYAVVERDGALLGVAGVEVYDPKDPKVPIGQRGHKGRKGLLRSVAVNPSRQGTRFGAALVRDRLAWAETQGLESVYLLTTTAAGYFQRFGFKPLERSAAPPEIQASVEFQTACPATAALMVLPLKGDGRWVREVVREKYAAAARGLATCCETSSGLGSGCGCGTNPVTSHLYDESETTAIPLAARLASLGCGNPTALAQLEPGETVLDLGSGGGLDVLLSAKRVGPAGKAFGLDMTDEMLTLARDNQAKAGIQNVEFLKGHMENIPLPESSVDVVVSNCVINLAADKDRVFREAFRVLKPAGRFAVSDVVVRGEVPVELRRSVELWVGCVAGALEESEYRTKLAAAGFEAIEIEPTRIYRIEDARQFLTSQGIDVDAIAPLVNGKFMSAFVRAKKPSPSCCGSSCCEGSPKS